MRLPWDPPTKHLELTKSSSLEGASTKPTNQAGRTAFTEFLVHAQSLIRYYDHPADFLKEREEAFVQPLKRYVDAGRHEFIAVAGRNPRLYAGYQYALRRHNRGTVVTSDTDLCAEAPPGSGNTFFITGFAMANPGVSIASHHHVFAQVERAQRFSVPLLLIVREPAACVLSRAVSFRDPIIVGPVYRQWLSFWRRAVDCIDDSVLIDFDTMTSIPGRVIDRLNVKFGTGFSSDFPSRDAVFATMDEERAAKHLPTDINPNRPDERKREMRSYLRPYVENHRLARQAAALYQQVMQRVDQHL